MLNSELPCMHFILPPITDNKPEKYLREKKLEKPQLKSTNTASAVALPLYQYWVDNIFNETKQVLESLKS